MMVLTTLSPRGMKGAVWSLSRGGKGTVGAAFGPRRVEGTVRCRVSSVRVEGAFRGTLLSCRGMHGAVGRPRGVNWTLGERFGFGVGRAVGGVCLVWTMVQRGGAAEARGEAAEGRRADETQRSNDSKCIHSIDIYDKGECFHFL